MTVYIDDMYRYPMGQFGRMKMSHMIADTRDELLAMADKIGVQRRWIQKAGTRHEHFDVSMAARAKAIAAGAVPMEMRDLCEMWHARDVAMAEDVRVGIPRDRVIDAMLNGQYRLQPQPERKATTVPETSLNENGAYEGAVNPANNPLKQEPQVGIEPTTA